jgi:hypothetical protein
MAAIKAIKKKNQDKAESRQALASAQSLQAEGGMED